MCCLWLECLSLETMVYWFELLFATQSQGKKHIFFTMRLILANSYEYILVRFNVRGGVSDCFFLVITRFCTIHNQIHTKNLPCKIPMRCYFQKPITPIFHYHNIHKTQIKLYIHSVAVIHFKMFILFFI